MQLPLTVPTVRDRVVQAAIVNVIEPIFEPRFHDHSYGFIPGRNCHQAVERVLECHRQGYRTVLDADIQGFFDNLPHSVIMAAVAAEVSDGNILTLLERFLTAGVMEDGVFKPTTIGTPQGGVISPLLANIVLDHLDWQLHAAGNHFARYADDFVVLCQTDCAAQEALELVRRVLEGELGLRLSPEKTRITTYGKGYDFLGFHLSARSRRMRDKSVQKFKSKVRELTPRHHNLERIVIMKLNRVIRGTANYFATAFSTCRWAFQKLDSWTVHAASLYEAEGQELQRQRETSGGIFPVQTRPADLGGVLYVPRHSWPSMPRDSPSWGNFVWGRPVRDPHAGKYGELTPSRRRGGGGRLPRPLPYPLFSRRYRNSRQKSGGRSLFGSHALPAGLSCDPRGLWGHGLPEGMRRAILARSRFRTHREHGYS